MPPPNNPNEFILVDTQVINNTTYTTKDGATEIFLLNTGNADGKFTGSLQGAVPVTLPKGAAFSLGYIRNGYKPITIDATGTTIEITIVYSPQYYL